MSNVSANPGFRWGALLVAALFLMPWPARGFAQVAAPRVVTGDQAASAIRARIGLPADETIKAYVDAGAKDTKAHVLTDREWALVENAIADLPVLYRQTLERRLARLSFIDAPTSAGTALTRASKGANGELMFDITIRADVLEKSLSAFLTQKEAMLFSPDGSGYSVKVTAGQTSALTYILLHETTHVIDRALDLTMTGGPFRAIWTDYRSLAQPHADGTIAHSVYRREPKLPLSQSPALYQALGRSPFVSLYSTASAGEDFAELLAWRELSRRLGAPLKFQVLDARGAELVSVEPLTNAVVRSRFEAAQAAMTDARTASPDKL
ncbi:hypothetical protein SAMN02800694_2496 [Luteibacter sp. UNCMF331Sha3.1]|uniref:hypothetical protein n=1 Tax=Luteibacter sp. UNCMF331Sha3.1 TaxID=1502760 RepID=UPI0008D74136|nr:hypothetical protein [Luteibacter sp. UNCMF331Sha3.1]SEN01599.1 hypothetical protein SAMN02800694_2496 [Luteibacter sp. UNCMF331Sha3.1]